MSGNIHHAVVEEIETDDSDVGFWIFGFFLERHDPAVRIDLRDAVAGGIRDPHPENMATGSKSAALTASRVFASSDASCARSFFAVAASVTPAAWARRRAPRHDPFHLQLPDGHRARHVDEAHAGDERAEQVRPDEVLCGTSPRMSVGSIGSARACVSRAYQAFARGLPPPRRRRAAAASAREGARAPG